MSVKPVWQRNLDSIVRHAGPVLMDALQDQQATDIILNPDGRLWIERIGEAMTCFGAMESSKAEALIRTIAGCHGLEVTFEKPLFKCKFPLDGSRFSCAMPPVVDGPTFAIRKKAIKIMTLAEYVSNGSMTEIQMQVLKQAIREHKNILVSGGTSSGKTTLTNSLISTIADLFPKERILFAEEVGELQCKMANVAFYTTTDNVSMTHLIKTFLTMRPNRIGIGEVTDSAALDLMDAWSSGHPGGICTFHANNAPDSLERLKGLISRNQFAPREIEPVIARAANIIVHMGYSPPEGRKIQEIIEIKGFENGKYLIEPLA